MLQKVLKVGSSVAVTIPKKSLKNLGIKAGDTVNVSVNEAEKRISIESAQAIDRELVDWMKGFIKRYKKALDELSQK